MNIYYVYAYLRKSDDTPYYIGKGNGDRAYDQNHTVIVPKDKSKIVFLERNLTELGAFALERRMIRWYGRKDLGTGILRNRTDGGEGAAGMQFSQTHRQRIGAAHTGRKHTADHRRNNSLAQKASPNVRSKHQLGKNNHMYGRIGEKHHRYNIKHSVETCQLISTKHHDVSGANNPRAKTILLHTPSGEIIRCFGNLKATCNELGISFSTVFKTLETGAPVVRGRTKGYIAVYGE
jgi:hypothetical protein